MENYSIAYIRDGGGIFGAERVILTTAKNLDDKYNVILICMKSHKDISSELIDKAKSLGIKVITVDVAGKFDVRAIYNIRTLLIENHVKIIHSYDFKSNLYGLFASINLGIKRIITAGGTTRDSMIKKLYMYIDENITYRYYNVIIAVSKDIGNKLLKKRFGKDKVIVIENGIDPSQYEEEVDGFVGNDYLSSLKNNIRFAVIGRLYPDKGHRFFISAFSEVVKKYTSCVALIIGDGPAEENIKQQIKELNIEKYVHLCGVKKNMKYIYNNIDYLVIPSLTEGLPYVLLEAMLYKVPVLSTHVGGIPDLITNGATGYLVPPGDVESLRNGMENLLNNPEKSQKMAENAYVLVKEKYFASRMVDHIGRLYGALINNDPVPHM